MWYRYDFSYANGEVSDLSNIHKIWELNVDNMTHCLLGRNNRTNLLVQRFQSFISLLKLMRIIIIWYDVHYKLCIPKSKNKQIQFDHLCWSFQLLQCDCQMLLSGSLSVILHSNYTLGLFRNSFFFGFVEIRIFKLWSATVKLACGMRH